MAVVATLTGRIDLPVGLFGMSNQPGKLSATVVTATIQSGDYSSGVLLTNFATAANISSVVGAIGIQVKIAAGTTQFGFFVHDVANNKLRFFSAITNQTTATDYTAANNDVWTVLIIGI